MEHPCHTLTRRLPTAPTRGSSPVCRRRPRRHQDTPTRVSWHNARHKSRLWAPLPDFIRASVCGSRGDAHPKPLFMAYGLPQMTLSEPPRSTGEYPSHTPNARCVPSLLWGSVPQVWSSLGAPMALPLCAGAGPGAPRHPHACLLAQRKPQKVAYGRLSRTLSVPAYVALEAMPIRSPLSWRTASLR